MCGIFGLFSEDTSKPVPKEVAKKIHTRLATLSESRGKEASGFSVFHDSNLDVVKSALPAKKLVKSSQFDSFYSSQLGSSIEALIGHSRLATHGTELLAENNQPLLSNGYTLVHNGIITNYTQLWNKLHPKKPCPELDTQVLTTWMDHFLEQGNSLLFSLSKAVAQVEGSLSLAILDTSSSELHLFTNTGSLYYSYSSLAQAYVFASERVILEDVSASFILTEIIHLIPGTMITFADKSEPKTIALSKVKKSQPTKSNSVVTIKDSSHFFNKLASPSTAQYTVKNSISQLKKHAPDFDAIKAIPRCTKCILPATTPFITFDVDGICNYCHEHQPITHRGLEELKEKVAPFKKDTGEPDCMIAFSGGRDSSYGLHFLVKELGLRPLAYTYDWGMVTDIGRRNQARVISKLGIEHIIVSADIVKKRRHIHKHIKAWMNKPDLGMVPLFMEGDKQCEFYADQLMKRYGLELMFFCRGNEFEKEEFKVGHCGITDADPGGVIHNLSVANKARLALYYLKQYLYNPAYINESIFDTLFAYFSTYIQKHNYLFLWHYIPWDEPIILSTLRSEYNWETSSETNSTWRTDDGTSSFYNYIYYTAQGFTENDSFRARQVREGVLTRKEALQLVHHENKPRYKALQWYFDQVGLDGDEVLEIVDTMPKLYPVTS